MPGEDGSSKRKLACQACRARRIRCEWLPDNPSGCVACGLADLNCPGEPEPRKRPKKGQKGASPPPTQPVEALTPQIIIGGALTFHLIESILQTSPPIILGLPYDFIRNCLDNWGLHSAEGEVASECLCAALLPMSAMISDHSTFIGESALHIPTPITEGTSQSYSSLAFASAIRPKPVSHLLKYATDLLKRSKISSKCSIENLHVLLVYDEMSRCCTGMRSREYINQAIAHFKTLVGKGLFTSPGMSEVGLYLVNVDAEIAATTKTECVIRDAELDTFAPSIGNKLVAANIMSSCIFEDSENSWTELCNQLKVLYGASTILFRKLVFWGGAADVASNWGIIDACYLALESKLGAIHQLESLDTADSTFKQRYSLTCLVYVAILQFILLDILGHEKILQAFIAMEKNALESFTDTQSLMTDYHTSRLRMKGVFEHVTKISDWSNHCRSLEIVRKLFQVLENSSCWTSLRKCEETMGEVLLSEIGIEKDGGTRILRALDLASWSDVVCVEQAKGLEKALISTSNTLTKESFTEITSPTVAVGSTAMLPNMGQNAVSSVDFSNIGQSWPMWSYSDANMGVSTQLAMPQISPMAMSQMGMPNGMMQPIASNMAPMNVHPVHFQPNMYGPMNPNPGMHNNGGVNDVGGMSWADMNGYMAQANGGEVLRPPDASQQAMNMRMAYGSWWNAV